MTVAIIFFILFTTKQLSGQNTRIKGFDVSIHGYIFLTKNGLFFQPTGNGQFNNFVTSLNQISFKIEETNEINYSDALQGVGKSIVVKNYTDDTLLKNPTLKVFDTIYYFKCVIDIAMNFFEKDYTEIQDIGYAFLIKDSLVYYGNLAIRNQITRIIPDELIYLKQFYNSYKVKHIGIPEWMKDIYAKKIREK